MPNTIQYPKNPNIETAFVVQNDGTKNRALMIAPQDISTLELPSNPNSTKGYVTINSKKQRVLLTADISGNGGGSVDYDRVIEKTDTIPSVSDVDVGKVYMYTGASNASYTHGYIYECVATQTASAVAFTGNIISSWAVADFVTYLQDGGSAYDEVTHGSLTYDLSGDLWTLVGLDENNIIVMTLKEYTQDLLDAGCTFVGTPQDGDTCNFTLTTTASGKKWKQLDVQPGGGSGGAVDSVNGKTGTVVLTASDVGALPDTTPIPDAIQYSSMPTAASTNEGDIVQFIGTTDATYTNGYFYKCVENGGVYSWVQTSTQPTPVTSVNSQTGAVVLTASDVNALPSSTVIPDVVQYSTMPTAGADNLGDIVQFTGTTDATYTNGYFYKCVSDGQVPATYSWTRIDVQPGSSLPSQTGQSGKYLTTNGTTASWATISGLQNTATGTNSLTILGTAATGGNAVNIGYGSSVQASCVAIGKNSEASNYDGCVAIGFGASAKAARSVAVGSNARVNSASAEGTIVIGRCSCTSKNTIVLNATIGAGLTAINDPNSMYVAITDATWYKLLSSDGTIPAARLASTTGLADGNYRLRLTVTDGFPTLSWVAE